MDPQLVRTKLVIPQIHRSSILRPRLSALLDEARQYPLVLVSSQAGSGKTTALAQWAGQLSLPAAWLSLEKSDNDLPRFLRYLVASLQGIFPEVGKDCLEMLTASGSPQAAYLAALLANDLGGKDRAFVLVLDDFHHIQASPILQLMDCLVAYQPPQMHLVLSTRVDPRLPLARLRAKSKLLEIRMERLRFSEEEAAVYLNRVMGFELGQEKVHTLWTRTEGWIASLQMAALSLRHNPDVEGFIRAFSGSNRYVMDYLLEEVLLLQPEPLQNFLLRTSILERLNGALCDAVLDQESPDGPAGNSLNTAMVPGECPSTGQGILEMLERNNLFVIALDDERQWYRYHHLFASLLQVKLAQTGGQNLIQQLHLRAADWYERNRFPEDAIEHALAAADFPQAARIMENIAEELWLRGEYAQIRRWIAALPVELARGRPWLCIWNAWSLLQTGLLREAGLWIDAAGQAGNIKEEELVTVPPASSEAHALYIEIATLRSITAHLAGDHERSARLASWVLKNPPERQQKGYLTARCQLLHGLGVMNFDNGELSGAEQTFLDTMRLCREIGFTLRYLHAANYLAYVYRMTARLHQCDLLLRELFQHLEQQGSTRQPAAVILHCRLVDLLYEWNRLDEARMLLQDVFRTCDAPQPPFVTVDLYNLQARELLLENDYDGAQNALSKAAALAHDAYIWQGLAWQTETLQLRLWLEQGDLSRAEAWAGREPTGSAASLSFSEVLREIARARILLAKHEATAALRLIHRSAAVVEAAGWKEYLIILRVLEALALQAAGSLKEALQTLEYALTLAEPEGYARIFLDEGERMAALLSRMAREGRSHQSMYARQLLATNAGKPGTEPDFGGNTAEEGRRVKPNSQKALPVETLSKRELEVLGCMAEGLSNRETARRLVIEISTVKRHINSIFGKLGASSRVQAINKAKENGILHD